MLSKGWTGKLAATFLVTILGVAALPSSYAGFALDDVRRPIYRGNVRYKNFINAFVNTKIGIRPETNRYGSFVVRHFSDVKTRVKRSDLKHRTDESNGDDKMWSLVPLAPSSDSQTKNIVKHFLTNSLQDLSGNVSNLVQESKESLDKLIMEHTTGQTAIQMVPEGSPSKWLESSLKPSVILVEDVHPSKLPKPPWAQWEKPMDPWPSNNVEYSPIPILTKPKPVTVKPMFEFDPLVEPPKKPVQNSPTTHKPIYTYPKPVISKPVYQNPPPTLKPILKPEAPKPTGVIQSFPTAFVQQTWTSRPSQPSVVIIDSTPQSYKPPYVGHKPLPVFNEDKPIYEINNDYRPVNTYPKPQPNPEPPPSWVNKPHKPHAPYRDPPNRPNSALGPTLILTQTTSLPPVRPVHPPPPTIVIIDSNDPSPSPPKYNCGTVQVLNSVKKEENIKQCSDVTVFLNSPVAVAGGGSAAASSGGGGAAAGGALAAGGAAVAGGAAAAGAAGAAGVAGLGAAGLATAGIVTPVAAAGAPNGATPLAPASAAPVGPAGVHPALHPLGDDSDEDYDYDTPSSTEATSTSKPTKKPTQSTLFDVISSFSSAVPYIGPITVSLWIIFLGPLAFILLGALGVGSFIFPWVIPRIVLGRRRRSLEQRQLPDSAVLFEKNLKLGYFDKYT